MEERRGGKQEIVQSDCRLQLTLCTTISSMFCCSCSCVYACRARERCAIVLFDGSGCAFSHSRLHVCYGNLRFQPLWPAASVVTKPESKCSHQAREQV